ncbi:MAG TPA: SAM-dependent methyltransferase [Streptosporangiaceae bacterium]|jgi:O-methyltransferase involved in polyketide biosynthesis
MSSEPLAPFDRGKPNIARAYDFFLGGKDNFAADRELAAKILAVYPLTEVLVRENRAFLARAVDFVSRQGITQFIDIGSGLPTTPNTHEVAGKVNPDARVTYVDNDPVVLSHARALLAAAGRVDAVAGDLRDPDAVLASVRQAGMIDLDQPVCVILGMILHFFDQAEADNVTAELVRTIVPGSFMIMSTGVNNDTPELADRFGSTYNAATVHSFDRKIVAGHFAGLELVEPGLTEVRNWRPEFSLDETEIRPGDILGGVGRKLA